MQAQNIVAAIKSHEPATEMLDSFFVTAEYHRHCWLGNSDFNHFFDAALEFANFEVLTWLKTHRLKHSVDFDRIVFMVAARLRYSDTILIWLTAQNPQTTLWSWNAIKRGLSARDNSYYSWLRARTPNIVAIMEECDLSTTNISLIACDRLINMGLTPKLWEILLSHAAARGNIRIIEKLTNYVADMRAAVLADGRLLRRVKNLKRLKYVVHFLRLSLSDCAAAGLPWPLPKTN